MLRSENLTEKRNTSQCTRSCKTGINNTFKAVKTPGKTTLVFISLEPPVSLLKENNPCKTSNTFIANKELNGQIYK